MLDASTTMTLKAIETLIAEGRFAAAAALCEELVQQQPGVAEGWFWLGHGRLLGGELAAADGALAEAVRLAPGHALAWSNRSVVALGLGKFAEAESYGGHAVALEPVSDAHWINLGNALLNQGRLTEANDAYRRAVALEPQSAAAWANLAAVAERQGDAAAAQEAYERNLTLAPQPEMAIKYAALLVRRDQLPLAVHVLRQVVDQVPGLVLGWLVLGDALGIAGDSAGANAAYRRALEIEPGNRQAKLSLGVSEVAHFRYAEAESLARQLIGSDPRDAEAWALLAVIQRGQAKIEEAIESTRRAAEFAADPLGHRRFLLALMQYSEQADAAQLLAEHRAWDEAHARPLFPAAPPVARRRAAGDRLRIGLVSSNFGRHPIAYLALTALERLDKSRCLLVCYSDRGDEDDYTARFRAASDDWQRVAGIDDEGLARLVREHQIDVLIDMMGHTGPRALAFARKPAPVQATWLGYVGTTGLAAMDFLVADRYHVRPDEKAWYREEVLRLPHSYACYGPPEYAPEVGPLPAAASGRFTFGSFNNPAKLTPRLLDAWAAILQRVPQSQLLLRFGGLGEPQVQAPIRERLAGYGIAAERIIMEGNSPHPELLAAYGRVDLALDTQPYSGGVTTCEALWMGVPVVTWPGRTFAGRHSTSYLSSAGFTEFVAADVAGYIDLAVAWAGRLEELAELRQSLRERMRQSPVCDAGRFARDWVEALERAFEARSEFRIQNSERRKRSSEF